MSFNQQAQLFAKREHEGVVQMLEVSLCCTTVTAGDKQLNEVHTMASSHSKALRFSQEFRKSYQNIIQNV